ncbi:hypothetical protein ACFLZL_01530 [Thermodesulfobacteriota bacterium]
MAKQTIPSEKEKAIQEAMEYWDTPRELAEHSFKEFGAEGMRMLIAGDKIIRGPKSSPFYKKLVKLMERVEL